MQGVVYFSIPIPILMGETLKWVIRLAEWSDLNAAAKSSNALVSVVVSSALASSRTSRRTNTALRGRLGARVGDRSLSGRFAVRRRGEAYVRPPITPRWSFPYPAASRTLEVTDEPKVRPQSGQTEAVGSIAPPVAWGLRAAVIIRN
jgi:hypothetical protein